MVGRFQRRRQRARPVHAQQSRVQAEPERRRRRLGPLAVVLEPEPHREQFVRRRLESQVPAVVHVERYRAPAAPRVRHAGAYVARVGGLLAALALAHARVQQILRDQPDPPALGGHDQDARVGAESACRTERRAVEVGRAREQLAAEPRPHAGRDLERPAERHAVLAEAELAVVVARVVPVERQRLIGRKRHDERTEVVAHAALEQVRVRGGDLLMPDPREARRVPEERRRVVGDGREGAAHADRARTDRHLVAGRGAGGRGRQQAQRGHQAPRRAAACARKRRPRGRAHRGEPGRVRPGASLHCTTASGFVSVPPRASTVTR